MFAKEARHVKASPGSVRRGRDACVQHAEAGLQAKPYPGGSHPKLTAYRRQQLIDLLRQGAWPMAIVRGAPRI
jgi:hypothetical protein